MKYILLLLSCFILEGHAAFSQKQSGEITYKIKMTDDFSRFHDTIGQKEHIKRHFFKEYLSLKSTVPSLSHTVIFNNKAALSTTEEVMDSDAGYSIRNAKMTTYTDNVYYFDFVEHSSTQQFKNFGKSIRVKRFTDSLHWSLKNKYKKILGYKCQKATISYSFNFLVKNKITAWFAPKLPFLLGPIGISGLPGAILEVEKKGIYFIADKIKFGENRHKISPPDKGKLLTGKEYKKMIMKNDPRAKHFVEKQAQKEK